MPVLTLARRAMATRFEVVLHGGNIPSLRAAAEEALDEVERIEARLSLFRPESEIAFVNRTANSTAARVSPELFALLQQAKQLSAETLGAFDITVGPLVECWGFRTGAAAPPAPEQVLEARSRVGMHLVELDARASTVAFACPGVQLDLGAIGKGYAVERAADILRESGATSALIHGGTSSIHALGRPPEAESWQVAIELHSDSASGQLATPAPPRLRGQPRGQSRPAPPRAPVVVSLKDESLSVSAVWGRYLDAGVRRYGHVLDPRSGVPVEGAVLGAVLLPSATETDALSTALLVLGRTGGGTLGGLRPGARWLQVFDSPDGIQVTGAGIPGVALEEGH